MGLIDSIRGVGDHPDHDDAERNLKCWTVRHSPTEGKGGWASVDGWEELATPPSKTEFELNTTELDPGVYRLFWVEADTERIQVPDDDEAWKHVVEGDQEADDRDDLEAKVDQLLAQQAAESQEREEAAARPPGEPEDVVKWQTLNNPQLMERYADLVVPAAWGITEPGGGLGFDQFEKNPLGALMYDAYNNPEKVRKAGENLGAGFGAGLDGFFRGMEEPDTIADDGAAADDVDEDEPEEFRPTISSEDAAIDMDELADYKPDFEDFVRAQEGPQADAGGTDEAAAPDEGEPSTEPSDDAEADESDDTPDLEEELPRPSDEDDIEAAAEALE